MIDIIKKPNYFELNHEHGAILVDVHIGSDNYFRLTSLWIEKDYRNNGIANELMNKLIEILPEYSKIYNIDRIVLYVEPMEHSIPFKLLKHFYAKFGFKNVKGYKTEFMKLNI
jgi:ribosomal protein S18 acetylase RimI-like enzyme